MTSVYFSEGILKFRYFKSDCLRVVWYTMQRRSQPWNSTRSSIVFNKIAASRGMNLQVMSGCLFQTFSVCLPCRVYAAFWTVVFLSSREVLKISAIFIGRWQACSHWVCFQFMLILLWHSMAQSKPVIQFSKPKLLSTKYLDGLSEKW